MEFESDCFFFANCPVIRMFLNIRSHLPWLLGPDGGYFCDRSFEMTEAARTAAVFEAFQRNVEAVRLCLFDA